MSENIIPCTECISKAMCVSKSIIDDCELLWMYYTHPDRSFIFCKEILKILPNIHCLSKPFDLYLETSLCRDPHEIGVVF